MDWLMIAVVLAAAGLLVVAFCAVRAVFALRRLSREVRRLRAGLARSDEEPGGELVKTAAAHR